MQDNLPGKGGLELVFEAVVDDPTRSMDDAEARLRQLGNSILARDDARRCFTIGRVSNGGV